MLYYYGFSRKTDNNNLDTRRKNYCNLSGLWNAYKSPHSNIGRPPTQQTRDEESHLNGCFFKIYPLTTMVFSRKTDSNNLDTRRKKYCNLSGLWNASAGRGPSAAKCLLLHYRAPEKSENLCVLYYFRASRAPRCPPKGSRQGV